MNAKAIPHQYCLNTDWGCTWKCPTNNGITTKREAKKQALKDFDKCPFNTSVTKETAHQANAGTEMLAEKHAASETPSKVIAKAEGIGERPCHKPTPRRQMEKFCRQGHNASGSQKPSVDTLPSVAQERKRETVEAEE